MAAELGISAASVSRYWRANGLKPHIVRGFKVSRDPKFIEKLEDIVGLYMSPPEHALVLCFDEKRQAAALTQDSQRCDTSTLFAALNLLDGQVTAQGQQRQRHIEWLKFLRQIERETPKDKVLHLMVDNYASHQHAKVQAWLAKHPRFVMHFTSSAASWLTMVERFFKDVYRLRLGLFASALQLTRAIDDYLAQHKRHPTPFIWSRALGRLGRNGE